MDLSLLFSSPLANSRTTAPTSSAITPISCLPVAFRSYLPVPLTELTEPSGSAARTYNVRQQVLRLRDVPKLQDLVQRSAKSFNVGLPAPRTVGAPAIGDGGTSALTDAQTAGYS